MAIGTLALAPSQNLFLGVPIEIMPEEARLLVEKGVGSIVDDHLAHEKALCNVDQARRADYLARLHKQSAQVGRLKAEEKQLSRKRGLQKQAKKAKNATNAGHQEDAASSLLDFDDDEEEDDESIFAPQPEDAALQTDTIDSESPVKVLPNTTMSATYQVTPATSRLLLPTPPTTPQLEIQNLPSSYPLYRHLHQKGYFMTPGLRFGCQYTVYPGDPLRFHSHFLAVGAEWDEELDLSDIVGGGRLGTGVKKGFLLGGESPSGQVRSFSVEWAAM
jgi:tRNA-splicing endonuclease subunit Sen34